MRARGLLIMAANSLGLPEDIPLRALEAVKTADLLIFEEDKPARQVLKAAEVQREYLKYNEQHQDGTLEQVNEALSKGLTVLYMSDQGCPTLEDPGSNLLRCAKKTGSQVKVIPGPSSLTAALSACPFKGKEFVFHGFLPREEEKRKLALSKMTSDKKLQILMDTPYRLKQVIESCKEVFNETTFAFIALDISGPDEDYLHGNFTQLLEDVNKIEQRLNFVLIICPDSPSKSKSPTVGRTANNNSNRRPFKKRK